MRKNRCVAQQHSEGLGLSYLNISLATCHCGSVIVLTG